MKVSGGGNKGEWEGPHRLGNSEKKCRAYGLNKQPVIDAKQVPAEDVQLDGCSSKKKDDSYHQTDNNEITQIDDGFTHCITPLPNAAKR